MARDTPAWTRIVGRFAPRWVRKLLVAAAVVSAGAILYCQFGGELTLAALVERERELRDMQREHFALLAMAAFALYVVVAALSIPVATVLSVLYGWLFGFWRALVLVSFASTLGATIAFLLCRYLFRDWVQQQFAAQLARVDAAARREGAYYLFTLRLIPYVPFWLVNLLMGLTPMRTRTFWWVSQLGMLPATALWIGVGASVTNLAEISEQGLGAVVTPQLLALLTLLGVFPLAARWCIVRIKAVSHR
jgi:uncharacterized membrane protein YdjX (TVP38/TMEM64 family)